jgi:sporulation protein YlmC with PRC-barrel domain
MNKTKLTRILCGGIISLTGASLLAQQSSSSGTSSTDPSSSSSTLGSSTSQSSSTSSSQWQHAGQTLRLSHLMNATVQGQDGKTLGTIRDFTIDPQTGQLQFAVLAPSSAAETAGTSSASSTTGKLIPVPWQLFSHSLQSSSSSSSTIGGPGSHNLVLNLDESKLQSAPSFDANSWSEMHQGSLDQRIYSYYGVNRMSGLGTSGSSISGSGGTQSSSHGSLSKDPSAQDYGTGNATGGTGAKGGGTDLQK